MKEMTWKSRMNRLFAHRFALPVLCWCAALVFWLVQGAVAFAGDSSAKAKGTLTETSIPIESWQLAELTWGEPGENSAPQGQLITTGGDPQMILEDVSGRVVRTVSYNVEFDGDSREMCLYYTTKTGEPYSQDRRVFPKVLADGTYVYTLPRTQIVALRLDPCSPDENKTVGLTFTPQSITLNAASTLPGGADYFIPTWYQLFGLIVYPALAAAALDCSYLYPMTILKGKGSRMEFTGITFAGHGQNLDTGAKVVHTGADTSSYINTKSISKDGGISTFRSAVVINKDAKNSKAAVSCQSLMLDTISRSDTIPAMDVRTPDADVGHEARIGRISDDAVFYLMSRGIPEEEARAMIVSGFADNVSKELPLEYAMEMNNLIRLEMKGSIG